MMAAGGLLLLPPPCASPCAIGAATGPLRNALRCWCTHRPSLGYLAVSKLIGTLVVPYLI
jgi:hypothetical protein